VTIIWRTVIAFFMAALSTIGSGWAASTTNYSDQWWVDTESGWGASVLQEGDVLFVDLFVYDSSRQPTWFTAAASLQPNPAAGHTVFSGDLYSSTGPYFGAASFDANQVTRAVVGTLTFDATSVNAATLSYTVNGAPVVKSVTRQTWRYDDLGGSYYGGWVGEQVACTPSSDNGYFESAGTIEITGGAAGAMTVHMVAPDSGDDLLFAGTYDQSGHMGRIVATMSASPAKWSIEIYEIERTVAGFVGRFAGSIQSTVGSCAIANGRITGIRR
jgi:hypothetical protein